jgi:hypothetical protein
MFIGTLLLFVGFSIAIGRMESKHIIELFDDINEKHSFYKSSAARYTRIKETKRRKEK